MVLTNEDYKNYKKLNKNLEKEIVKGKKSYVQWKKEVKESIQNQLNIIDENERKDELETFIFKLRSAKVNAENTVSNDVSVFTPFIICVITIGVAILTFYLSTALSSTQSVLITGLQEKATDISSFGDKYLETTQTIWETAAYISAAIFIMVAILLGYVISNCVFYHKKVQYYTEYITLAEELLAELEKKPMEIEPVAIQKKDSNSTPRQFDIHISFDNKSKIADKLFKKIDAIKKK